ncbi:phosphotransferase [Promicromonospora sp. NPDC050262]|uniref:phosphotransferase n=1 Tax=Promicromonospora sp. NPDC050262 TaxID=3155036 RepID=UPI0033EC38CF
MPAFSAVVTGDAWRAEAESWVADVVARRGHEVTSVAQPRVRPWSTQLAVETTGGRLWFKAGCAAMTFEPGLQTLLARLVPHEVDGPVAAAPDRGWMLTVDRGSTLADSHEPVLDDWVSVLRTWARLQRHVAQHADEAQDTGLPDRAPQGTADRFGAMLDRLATLPPGHPARLADDVAARLREAYPVVERASGTLGAGPFPTSLQHGDLHPGNVFVVDGDLRVFDFGDAQWAHPLETLMVPRAVVEHDGQVPWEPVQAAFLAEWDVPLDAGALDELLRAAAVTHAVNRSSSWWDALGEASDAEWADWGEAPARHLARVLDEVARDQA